MVGFMLFVYKNAAYGDEEYIMYLCDIDLVNDYAWELDFLTYLYTELNYEYCFHTKHLDGYETFFQV